jgi:hypothetical protein
MDAGTAGATDGSATPMSSSGQTASSPGEEDEEAKANGQVRTSRPATS